MFNWWCFPTLTFEMFSKFTWWCFPTLTFEMFKKFTWWCFPTLRFEMFLKKSPSDVFHFTWWCSPPSTWSPSCSPTRRRRGECAGRRNASSPGTHEQWEELVSTKNNLEENKDKSWFQKKTRLDPHLDRLQVGGVDHVALQLLCVANVLSLPAPICRSIWMLNFQIKL